MAVKTLSIDLSDAVGTKLTTSLAVADRYSVTIQSDSFASGQLEVIYSNDDSNWISFDPQIFITTTGGFTAPIDVIDINYVTLQVETMGSGTPEILHYPDESWPFCCLTAAAFDAAPVVSESTST